MKDLKEAFSLSSDTGKYTRFSLQRVKNCETKEVTC